MMRKMQMQALHCRPIGHPADPSRAKLLRQPHLLHQPLVLFCQRLPPPRDVIFMITRQPLLQRRITSDDCCNLRNCPIPFNMRNLPPKPRARQPKESRKRLDPASLSNQRITLRHRRMPRQTARCHRHHPPRRALRLHLNQPCVFLCQHRSRMIQPNPIP